MKSLTTILTLIKYGKVKMEKKKIPRVCEVCNYKERKDDKIGFVELDVVGSGEWICRVCYDRLMEKHGEKEKK